MSAHVLLMMTTNITHRPTNTNTQTKQCALTTETFNLCFATFVLKEGGVFF